ncbi:Lysine-specific demethylase REF6-like protein, partial [Drosera capensis]
MGTISDPNPTNPESIFPWLKTLPLAPEFHPSIHDFKDPIGYIFKIEKEASKFGICKIVPPFPPQSRKSVISNLNRSFSARNPKNQATFTTRMQQIGECRQKGVLGSGGSVQKSVWQSGENYTVQQFEAKAKGFAKSYVKDRRKGLSALEIETLYWKANGERPFSVEYANDMPGSGFVPVRKDGKGDLGSNRVFTVGETAWNMRGISRANGSLLKFMTEDIPGVTSPMVYIAMMFSWFAWHVEDHDLHSLNYLHMGAGKTWYGVPRDAAWAFEEVIRVHGYGDEINPLVTFAMLGEKTTVMSPEVLVKAGVSCCRLVQNAGEFVVTFPRAYHSGFSHGFNVGEASNIATPEWLRFAKEAAIRRASINYPPMVSHFQLLYDLALGIGSRSQVGANSGSRSSRLKDRKKGEGETLVKQLFLEDVVQNNDLLHTLGKDSTVVLLPPNSLERFSGSNSCIVSKCNPKQLSFNCSKEDVKVPGHKAPKEINVEGNHHGKQLKAFYSVKAKFSSVSQGGELHSTNGGDDGCTLPFEMRNCGTIGEGNAAGAGSSKRALFSCVKCGIWPFACAAIVQPTDATARYLMSEDADSFDDRIVSSGLSYDGMIVTDFDRKEPDSNSGFLGKNVSRELDDILFQCSDQDTPMGDQDPDHCESPRSQTLKEERTFTFSATEIHNESSALSLLAMAYAYSSDSEDDNDVPPDSPAFTDDSAFQDGSSERNFQRVSSLSSESQEDDNGGEDFDRGLNFSKLDSEDEISPEGGGSHSDQIHVVYEVGMGSAVDNLTDTDAHCFPADRTPPSRRCDDDSSRMHVFCLEHAVELEKRLRPFGGVHILLLCHPDYPKVEAAAKLLAEELELDQAWNETSFREATEEDEERIQMALEVEEASPKNGDWTIKLGINLYYSATLCRSPLYGKQMPYNAVIYNAFSCGSPPNSRLEPQVKGKGSSLVPKKSAKKRKLKAENRSTKKTKLVESETPDNEHEDSLAELFKEERSRRTIRKKEEMEIIASDFDDLIDSESPKMKEWEEHSLRPCIIYTQTNRQSAQPPEEDDTGSGPIRSKRIRKPRCFPDEDKGEVGIRSRKWISRKRDFPPELAEEAGPSTRLRMKTAVASDDLDTKPINKDEKKSALPRKGPRIMLPVTKASERKDPRVMLPVSGSSKRKGPRVMLPVSKTRRVPSSRTLSKKDASVQSRALKAPPVKQSKVEAKKEEGDDEYTCDIEGCIMSFGSREELSLHKRNICPVDGCDKKFFSHKYLVQHRRVHEDDRPLKCPWKGCKMSFKWAWARTEHIRVHTGARPYSCGEPGC